MGSGLDNNFAAVFASVSIPISQWWGGSHAVKRRRLAEENARQLLDDNAELLKIRMQKNWNDVDDAYKQLVLAKKSIEQSEENLRLNRNYYHAGTVTMNDLFDAQQQYQQCRDRYTYAYAALQTKIVAYEQSVGR
ncbi:MAG: TolC family protein [Prevotella sp.]|nr:TolC family protein [Prevotella sp.]MDY4038785.1 TolC family protein [Prevotella sp.]